MLKQRTRHSSHEFVNVLGQSLPPHIEEQYIVSSGARPVISTVVGTDIRYPAGEQRCDKANTGLELF